MLTAVGVLVAVALLLGCLLCRRRAPAVAAACVGGLAIGGWTVWAVTQHRGTDAPVTIALGASGGLGLAGLIGLLVTPHGNAASLRTAGITALLTAPVVGGAMTILLAAACPMYDERPSAGLCRYSVDVLGGWVGPTAVLAALDALVVGLLFLVSAKIAAYRAMALQPDEDR